MNTLIHHPLHSIELFGIKIKVFPEVFCPNIHITHSPSIMIQFLPSLENVSVLDIGSGTGFLSIYTKKLGAKKVTAIDIDPKAIENTLYNIKQHLLDITVFQSDLFSHIEDSFDLILANLPIDETNWKMKKTPIELVEQFLSEAKQYLNTNGKIYIPWFSISDILPLQALINTYEYKYHLHKQDCLGYTWYLFILSI